MGTRTDVLAWGGALVIVGAGLATFFFVSNFEISRKKPPVVTSPARERVRQEAPPPVSVQPIPRRATPPAIDPAAQSTLSSLMKTCGYWSAQPFSSYQQNRRVAACNRALQFAHANHLPPPLIPSSSPRTASAPAPSRVEKIYRVTVIECDSHRLGSIAYRRCRADEKARLLSRCRSWSTAALSAAPASPDAAGWMRAYCTAAERYEIVR